MPTSSPISKPHEYWHPLVGGNPPAWACEWGNDAYGVFASFQVGKVQQKMRWIPAGTFLMGSPPDEKGRYDNEDQHTVTLSRGLWLGETPCTQALWTEVMGKNPSEYVSESRPVEKVSWDECHEFFEKLRERLPAFAGRLPTEAEWEHACRAGYGSATWLGDLEILGGNNAPLLDEIAWYGGNSGVDFDLEEGYDSSDWPERQYPHTKAGTRPVGLKAPNPWGLYDILGNVLEWCSDWYGEYPSEPVVDPAGPEEGTSRVSRGGSWYSDARYVRSASRDWRVPGDRWSSLGFRLAQGPESPEG